jgi:hypothetical protein
VNRAAVFVDDVDRQHYLALLEAAPPRNEIALHAYVLMGNTSNCWQAHPEEVLSPRRYGTARS